MSRATRKSLGLGDGRKVGSEHILDQFLSELNTDADVPAVACGMIGAKDGWVEARYLPCPAKLSDIASPSIHPP